MDAADFTVWRDLLGRVGNGLPADGNGDGFTNQLDYDVWKMQFGDTIGSGSGASETATVPEPTTLVLLILTATGWCVRRGRAA